MKSLKILVSAAALALLLAACGSPYLNGKPSEPAGDDTPHSVTDTKFNYQMIFDCQRSSTATTFTAGALDTPMDDERSDLGWRTIDELDSTKPAYDPTYYITLDITTAADGDTITTAALTLRNASGAFVRTISADGAISYLGAEGFVYISDRNSAGYFFASSAQTKGTSVTYTYTTASVTKKSELGW